MPQLPGSWFLCGGFRLYPGHFRHAQVGAAIGDKPHLLGRGQGDAAVRHFMAEAVVKAPVNLHEGAGKGNGRAVWGQGFLGLCLQPAGGHV